MDGWMDGWTDGWTGGRVDGVDGRRWWWLMGEMDGTSRRARRVSPFGVRFSRASTACMRIYAAKEIAISRSNVAALT